MNLKKEYSHTYLVKKRTFGVWYKIIEIGLYGVGYYYIFDTIQEAEEYINRKVKVQVQARKRNILKKVKDISE